MLICKFCGKDCKSKIALGNHQTRCPSNPNRKLQVLTVEGRARKQEASRNRVWTEDMRTKLSRSMRQAVINNPDSYTSHNVCGRVKVEEYNGVKFHGKWEVVVASWLDFHRVKWLRNITPLNYFWNQRWHLYFPDFYLPDMDRYIEVKGYQTDRDLAKWSVLNNLVVLKSSDIKRIKRDNPPVAQLVEQRIYTP